MTNPLLKLEFEPVFANLGEDYADVVAAATFPTHVLRFRNDEVLKQLGLNPQVVLDDDFIEAFGLFQSPTPFLAMRYHGYQFGEYNPFLGDGRGFLYGQVRGINGELYDLGTKGSGTTPYSRGGDGRLTLKGGVREVLASEALHALGVRTSRCLSLIETGEALWRGDEPSPTRASVMVRFSRSHIRFGTFERLDYLGRTDLIQTLLDHVIETYYPALLAIIDLQERYIRFYAELVERVAQLAAQWVSVGFCHAVLNTDNMSITGESFDYGPYAFIKQYDPKFTAAYFDYAGRYSYGNQPAVCEWNLRMLHKPLQQIVAKADLESGLAHYRQHYDAAYQQRMLAKLGLVNLPSELAEELVQLTVQLLKETEVGYHEFFLELTQQFSLSWYNRPEEIFKIPIENSDPGAINLLQQWRNHYHTCLQTLSMQAMERVAYRLRTSNPATVLLRPAIEAIWEPITVKNDWHPFYELLKQIQNPFMASSQH